MRDLAKNRQTVYFAPFLGKTDEVIDGAYTGEKVLSYGPTQEAEMNVSPKWGSVIFQPFGNEYDYSVTATTTDMDCDMNEQSLVWLWKSPNTSHNYIVTRVSKSLNSITYALKEC